MSSLNTGRFQKLDRLMQQKSAMDNAAWPPSPPPEPPCRISESPEGQNTHTNMLRHGKAGESSDELERFFRLLQVENLHFDPISPPNSPQTAPNDCCNRNIGQSPPKTSVFGDTLWTSDVHATAPLHVDNTAWNSPNFANEPLLNFTAPSADFPAGYEVFSLPGQNQTEQWLAIIGRMLENFRSLHQKTFDELLNQQQRFCTDVVTDLQVYHQKAAEDLSRTIQERQSSIYDEQLVIFTNSFVDLFDAKLQLRNALYG